MTSQLSRNYSKAQVSDFGMARYKQFYNLAYNERLIDMAEFQKQTKAQSGPLKWMVRLLFKKNS